jgi:hypothetical protein
MRKYINRIIDEKILKKYLTNQILGAIYILYFNPFGRAAEKKVDGDA